MEGMAAILDSSDGPFVRSDMGSPSGDVQTWLWRILNMANKTHTYTHLRGPNGDVQNAQTWLQEILNTAIKSHTLCCVCV